MSQGRLVLLVMGLLAAFAWVNYAEHPTARNLRSAIASTLPLL